MVLILSVIRGGFGLFEKMLERMFKGSPEGMHDRILDYSTAVTGTVFFAPSADLLAGLDDD